MALRSPRTSALLVFISVTLAAGQVCSTPGGVLSTADTPAQHWAKQLDAAVEVQSVRTGDTTRHFVYGDEVRLSRDAKNLLSTGANCVTQAPNVVIEARVLIIDGQLCLQDASLTLRAHTILFENGWIRLGQPPAQAAQKVELTASVLDVRKAPKTFLRFATRDWFGNTWPQAGQPARTVTVTAGRVLASTPVTAANALAWVRGRTLDAGNTADPASWAGVYNVRVGADGQTAWKAEARTSHRWPQYTLSRMANTYYRAPYSKAMQAFITERLDTLAFLRENRSNPVYTQTERLRDQVRRQVDAFNMPAGATTMLNVDQLSKDLEKKLNRYLPESGTGLLDWWDRSWVASLRTGQPDLAAISVTRASLAERWKTTEDADVEIGALQTALDSVQKQAHQTQEQVNSRKDRLQREWEKRKKDAEDRQEVFKVAQTVTVVAGTLYPPVAPVAATLNQGLDILASADCNKLAGQSDGAAAFKAIEDANKRRSELNAALKQASDAYKRQKDAKAGARRYLTANDGSDAQKAANKAAYGTFTQSVNDWGAAGAKAVQLLNRDSCTKDLELPDFGTDALLQGYLTTLGGQRTEEARLIASLLVKQQQQTQLTQEIVQFETALNDLQALDLVNEASRIRVLNLSNGVRSLLYLDLLTTAARLRRALLATGVEVRDLPAAVKEVMASPDAFQVQLAAADWARSPDEWEQRLKTRRDDLRGLLATFIDRSDALLLMANTRVVNGRIDPDKFTAQAAPTGPDGPGRPARQAFVAALNAALRDVYQQGRKKVLQQHVPVLIPFNVEETDRPQYFVDAVVRSVEFQQAMPADWPELEFEVWNSGVGRLDFGNNRCLALFSDGTTPTEPAPTTITSSKPNLWSERVNSVSQSASLLRRAYPFAAQYFLTVKLPDPGDWPAAPQVKSITIDFVKRGPR